jgi:hypothetical protein
MSSKSYQGWRTVRKDELDKIEHAHGAVGVTGRGRWYATQQVNQAYVVLLASHFQGFCRDLHEESVNSFVKLITPAPLQPIIRKELLWNRQLDKGNAQPGSIGADFGRLGMSPFWTHVQSYDLQEQFQEKLVELNEWRNAIAHQDFTELRGSVKLRLAQVQQWRIICNRLARVFDQVMRSYLYSRTGAWPW